MGKQIFHSQQGQKKTRLFWQTLLSYGSVLLFPILICSIYYFQSYGALKQRILSNQRLILENSAKEINAVFRDAINLGSHLQLNKYTVALSGGKATPDSTPQMDRYYLKKDLASLQVSNSIIQRINLYFPVSEYIVNASSTYKLSLLPYMEAQSNTLSSNDWSSILEALRQNRIICYSSETTNFITIAQTILTDISGAPSAILCIQLDKAGLLDRLQGQLLPEDSPVFALIGRNRIFLSTDEQGILLSSLPLADFFGDRHEISRYTVTAKEEVIVDSCPLQISDTALISVTKVAEYRSQTNPLLMIMLLTILFCVLVGAAIIIYYSRKNYEPVSQILQFIQKSDVPLETDRNEYHFIMKILAQSRNEIEQQKNLLKNNYMQKILSGEIEFSQIPEQVAEQFSINLSFDSVCVVSLFIENTGNLAEPGNPLDLTAFTIENVFRELLGDSFHDHYFCVRNQKLSALVNVPSTASQPLEQIEYLTRKLLDFLQSSFQLALCAGISMIQTKEQIPDAYLQADIALKYQKLSDSGQICCYSSIPQEQSIGSIPLNTSEYVTNLVIHGNQSQICDYFAAIEKSTERLSWTDAKSCYYFFYQTTARLQLYCQTHYGFQTEALNFLNEAFFSQSLPNALAQTREAYLKASVEIAEKLKSTPSDRWGQDIRRFIDSNYFDANINLNTVAEHFHLSPSYLSRKFREQYQKSVVDYLYEVRICHSITLLDDTDLKIADIAQMTGFVDSNAFIRIFKKLKGTTPGKYKEKNH